MSLYFFVFLILALVFLTIYAAGQQLLRQGADDPQVQIAEDSAAYLSRTGAPADFDNPNKIDIARSLTPFLVIYSLEGRPLASSGQLGGQMPLIPLSVLEASTASGENRLTWQPNDDLRVALVVKPLSGKNSGYIAVGRSLRETERRENSLFKITGSAWLLTSLLWLAAIGTWKLSQKK